MPETLPPNASNDGTEAVGRPFCRRFTFNPPHPNLPGNEPAFAQTSVSDLPAVFAEIDAQLENLMLSGSLIVLQGVIDRSAMGDRVCLECHRAAAGYSPIRHAETCTVGLWLGLFDKITELLRTQRRVVAAQIAGLDASPAGYGLPPGVARSVAPEETSSSASVPVRLPVRLPEPFPDTFIETYGIVYDQPAHQLDVWA